MEEERAAEHSPLLYAGPAVESEGQERGARQDTGSGLGDRFGGRVAQQEVGGGQAERGVRAVDREETGLVGLGGQAVERQDIRAVPEGVAGRVGTGVGDGDEGAEDVVGVLGEGDGRDAFAVPDAVVEGGGAAVDFGGGAGVLVTEKTLPAKVASPVTLMGSSAWKVVPQVRP